LHNARPSDRARPRLFPVLVVALPLVLVAVVAAALLSRGKPPNIGQSGAAAPADPSGELARMQGEMQLMRRQMSVMAQQQAGAKPASTASEATAPKPPPPTQEEVSARDKRRFENLGRKLAAEPVDRSWAPATERLIATTLQKPIFKGSKLLSATCRSTLCRFEVSHDSDVDRRKFGSTLPNRLPSLPSGSMRNAEGDERKTIIYVAREGHRIPRDEPQ